MPDDSNQLGNDSHRSGIDRRRFLAGTAGATGLSLIAGCTQFGSGGGNSDTIKVGASAALTGKYSAEGKATSKGYKLWAKQINEHGGILTDGDQPGLLGKSVKLTVLDDQSDPSRAVNLYKRLINQENVDLLMGPYSSAVTNSVIPIIEQNQMACVSSMGSDTSVYTERDVKYVVQSIAPSPTYVRGAIDLAVKNNAKTLAAVYEDTAFPASVVEGHVPYAKDKGLEVVLTEAYPKDINDYTPVMNRVQSKDPDIVIGGGYTPDAIGLTKAAQSVGFSTGLFSWVVGGMAPSFYESVGSSARAITGDHWWTPNLSVPKNEGFKKGVKEFYGDEYETLEGTIDYHFPGGYAATLVMEQAVRNVGSLDQTKIAEELHTLEMGVPWGNGKYKVNKQGVQVGHRPALGQWQQATESDGLTREAIFPSGTATAQPVYPHPSWN